MDPKEPTNTRLLVTCILLAAVMLAADLFIPLSVADSVPYIILVLATLWLPQRHYVLWFALTGTILATLDFFLFPPDIQFWQAIINHLLLLFAIWVTALLLLYRKKLEQVQYYTQKLALRATKRTSELSRANQRLQQEITERKRTEQVLRNRFDQLQVVYQMTEAVSRAGVIEEIYKAALDGLIRALKADRAAVQLYDPDGVMHFKAWQYLSGDYREATEGHSPWLSTDEPPRPILISVVSQDFRLGPLQHVVLDEGIQAIGFIPLLHQKRLLGKLIIYYNSPHHFTDEEVQLAQTIASHIAIAVERKKSEIEIKQREEKLQWRNRELVLLNRINQTFISTRDLDDVLLTVLEEIRQALDVMACSTWLIDAETSELVCQQVTDPQSEIIRGWRLAPGEGLAGWVVQHGQSLIVPDIRKDQRHFEGVVRQTGLMIRSMVSVPLRVKEQIIGVIQVVDVRVNRFNMTHEILLKSLTATVAMAIENTRLYEQVQQHAEGLELLVQKRTARLRELERQRIESEKLAAAGRMAARIAHEINNPLAGIQNSFLLVKNAVSEDHPYYDYVGRIEKEIKRIARIVRQMYELYRPDREKAREFLADETIRDIVALLAMGSREHGVKIEVETGNSPLLVTMSEGLLRPVLYNIIQNAIEASPLNGIVKVAAEIVEAYLKITITDQGQGISEEVRPHIFEPFFTTKNNRPGMGLGLGLSISKSTVEAMNGQLKINSNMEQGTSFEIILPCNGLLSKGDIP